MDKKEILLLGLGTSGAALVGYYLWRSNGTKIPVRTCTELQNMKDNLTGNYYLCNDIDCSDTVNWNSGAGFEPVGNSSIQFSGTLDGQGYKVTSLYINRPYTNYVGLFGFISSGSEINNLGLEEMNVSAHGNSGGLVGANTLGTISNSYSSGAVDCEGSDCGNLIGMSSGAINNCYSTGTINGFNGIGGLLGWLIQSGTIDNCYSTVDVTGNAKIGGLVGDAISISLGVISNCYSTGNVSGNNEVGGLVGANIGTINTSYWDIYRSNQSNCVGNDNGTTNCIGKNNGNTEPDYWYYSTHAPMDQWDFINTWRTEETVTYPFLK